MLVSWSDVRTISALVLIGSANNQTKPRAAILHVPRSSYQILNDRAFRPIQDKGSEREKKRRVSDYLYILSFAIVDSSSPLP